MTEKQLRDKVCEIMCSWLGLDRAKGTHKPIIDLYNKQADLPRGYKVSYSDAYCATTVTAAFLKAGFGDICPRECSCSRMIEKAKEMGIWVEKDNYLATKGDIIMYDWDDDGKGDCTGNPEHTGIITDVVGDLITVTEGNKGGKVAQRTMKRNGRYIRGYITPLYSTKADKEDDYAVIAKEVIAGKWGNGDERRKRLASAGYSVVKVQAMVNRMLLK